MNPEEQKHISFAELSGWFVFTSGLSMYRTTLSSFELNPCEVYLFSLIPAGIFLLYPFFKNVYTLKYISIIFGISAAVSFYITHQVAVVIGIFSLSIACLPSLISSVRSLVWGVCIALLVVYTPQSFNLSEMVFNIIFSLCMGVHLFLNYKQIKPTQQIKSNTSISDIGNPFLYSIILLIGAQVLLLWWWAVWMVPISFYPTWVSSLLIIGGVLSYRPAWFIFKKSIRHVLYLFFTLFFTIIFQGLLSSTVGIGFQIILLLLLSALIIILSLLVGQISPKNLSMGSFVHSRFHYWVFLTLVCLILILHIPGCYDLFYTIKRLGLPESLYSLSTSQLFLKNLSILPALACILTGIYYLKSRSNHRRAI
ncbi:MAG: hypothetical protein WAT79_06865 [Saprospiraceae bacterium]